MTTTVTGVGGALAKKHVPNTSFSHLDIDEGWIESRTGVRGRFHMESGDRLADLAAEAARGALVDSGVDASAVDMTVVATSTADRISPGIAPELVHLLGAGQGGAIDVSGACTGFMYALDYAIARIDQGASERVLVVGADAMSRITDVNDRNTAALFGDGAGAVLVEAKAGEVCDLCAQCLTFGSRGSGIPSLQVARESRVVEMDGAEVYAAAVDAMTEEIRNVLRACECTEADMDFLVCHQANERIVQAVARRLRWPRDKTLSYVGEFGNTSSASIPLALWRAQNDRLLHSGSRLALAAFGAGFTWGAGVINWKGCRHT